jgi:hypothetical protein
MPDRQKPRAVDHLVLPVADIAVARQRLTRLGFTVAADARHPFGTENACVFLADGTYLEPLGVASLDECVAAARDGNVFVAHNQRFRADRGFDGFSGIAIASDDAPADHARFVDAGFSAGGMLQFSRPMTMPDGSSSTAGFSLAFAAAAGAPDLLLFAVQRINPLPADRGGLERHANGVTGISQLLLSAGEPQPFANLLETVFAPVELVADKNAIRFDAANLRICIGNTDGFEAMLGIASPDGDIGLRARAIIFKVSDLSVTAAVLAANGIATVRNDHHILVSEAPGQGAVFLFEE